MIASPKAAAIGTGIARGIETYGDLIWVAICDHFPPDTLFSIEDCVPLVQRVVSGGISHRYAVELARGTLFTVLDQGNGAVRRYGRQRWTL
jgi:hypothetical protein